ncbi:MAG: hypothetical protein ACREC6_11645, partial [Hyphomicrobiaceae bacterium]
STGSPAVFQNALFWFGLAVAVYFFLFLVSSTVLVKYKWFRKLMWRLQLTSRPHEGLWAMRLRHPKHSVSLARIRYSVERDEYLYDGWAYESETATHDDATWRSTSFSLDTTNGRYNFTCDGDLNMPDNATKHAKVSRVSGIGYLQPNEAGTRMSGTAMEYSWPDSILQTPNIHFTMDVYKVTRADIRTALRRKFYQRTGQPENAHERLAVIKRRLERVSGGRRRESVIGKSS